MALSGRSLIKYWLWIPRLARGVVLGVLVFLFFVLLASWFLIPFLPLRPSGRTLHHLGGLRSEVGQVHVQRGRDASAVALTLLDRVTGELVVSSWVDRPFAGLTDRVHATFISPIADGEPPQLWHWNQYGFTTSSYMMSGYARVHGTVFDLIRAEAEKCNLSIGEVQRLAAKTRRVLTVAMPVWGALLLTGFFPLVYVVTGPVRRWRRRKRGLCEGCGYDLRGNVSGVCSECGRETTKAPRHKEET